MITTATTTTSKPSSHHTQLELAAVDGVGTGADVEVGSAGGMLGGDALLETARGLGGDAGGLGVGRSAARRNVVSSAAVGAYIGAAYWFTSSTSFANPAVTIGRIFSDTFAGIAPTSVPGFVIAQLIGAAVGAGLVLLLYPDAPRSAPAAVVPHDSAV